MEYYVGLDVSLRTVAICVINADGKLIFERSVACGIEDIVECLRDACIYKVLRNACQSQSEKGPIRVVRWGHCV